MKSLLTLALITISLSCLYSQDSTLLLGKTDKSNQGAIYDISDPSGVNIEVNLWGFVRLPGRYRIPINTTFMDLMSYSGGPLENTKLEDLRIVRTEADGKIRVIRLNYGDLLWEDEIKTLTRDNPVLKSGDIILVPETRRYTFRDNIQFYFPLVAGLISIATFIITVSKP